jgi:phosphatidylserine/phosphatidylglycerophosphate/cardiolipin synthase-like enzyme
VQAYSFTSAPIAGALKAARDRGVAVKVILDKSQRSERYTGLTYLVHAGVPVWVDSAHAIAHNKVMVFDGRMVATGSFNFTKAAEEKNGENLLLVESPALAEIYTRNWQDHLAHSERADEQGNLINKKNIPLFRPGRRSGRSRRRGGEGDGTLSEKAAP